MRNKPTMQARKVIQRIDLAYIPRLSPKCWRTEEGMGMNEEATPADQPVIRVRKDWCKACGICAELCPRNVLVMEHGLPIAVRLEACTACGLCEVRCPDFAITVTSAKKRSGGSK